MSTEPAADLPTDPGDRRRSDAPLPGRAAVPGEAWGRYVIEGVLGEGGSGRVFRAYDPGLRRRVALKCLRFDDPATVERFLAEARAQAGVEHENVGKVYEIGEADGRPYIAMQLIDGPDLLWAPMTRAEQVAAVAAAAEAVHAAHRKGLIHRDLKPANVLVEKREDGTWKPYVVDFGIARAADAAGLTRAGTAIGTLPYMAPEQALGDSDAVGRAADVYALGATLYHLVGGRPPVHGGGEAELFDQLLRGEPPPLSRLAPDVPRDLEVIVGKCLERDPRRRYPSARALAEDLRRFLDGEPILARPASRAERLLRRLRRNRAAAAAAAVALAAVVVLGGWGVAATLRARRDAEAAHRFGREVERIEAATQTAVLLPLHDTGPERAAVRARMAAVEEQLDGLGGFAAGAAHSALGRGHLALDEPAEARRHLEHAWALGHREPEVAFALGRARIALYRRALDELQQMRPAELRAARRREVEAEFRALTLAALEASAGAARAHPAYLAGLLAFVEGRYDEALAKGAEAAAVAPLHEARVLIGDAHRARGVALLERGEYEAARAELERAGAAFAAAAEVARSAAPVYAADCERWLRTLEVDLLSAAPAEAAYLGAVAACDRALAAHSGHAEAHARRAEALRRWGEHRSRLGEDPEPLFADAVAAGRRAVEADPESADGYLTLGTALLRTAERAIAYGRDPLPALDEATAVFERAAGLNRRLVAVYNDLGMAWGIRADYQHGQGLDPRPALEHAASSFRRASDLDPGFAHAWSNAGLAAQTLAEAEIAAGRDGRPALDQAFASFDRALALNPRQAAFHSNRGLAWQTLAEAEAEAGGDPRRAFAEAEASFAAALALEPGNVYAMNNAAANAVTEAAWLEERGLDPAAVLTRAHERLAASLALDPTDPTPWFTRGLAGLVEARWTRHRGGSPAAALARAEADLERCLSFNPEDAQALEAMAEVEAGRALAPAHP